MEDQTKKKAVSAAVELLENLPVWSAEEAEKLEQCLKEFHEMMAGRGVLLLTGFVARSVTTTGWTRSLRCWAMRP